MGLRDEQIDKWTPPSRRSPLRREVKRHAARARRRAEKRDPENAPVKVIRGWAD